MATGDPLDGSEDTGEALTATPGQTAASANPALAAAAGAAGSWSDGLAALYEELARPIEQVQAAALAEVAAAANGSVCAAVASATQGADLAAYGSAALNLIKEDAYSRLVSNPALPRAAGVGAAATTMLNTAAGTAFTSGAWTDSITAPSGVLTDVAAGVSMLDGSSWADRLVGAGVASRTFDAATLLPAAAAAVSGTTLTSTWAGLAAESILGQKPWMPQGWDALGDLIGSVQMPHLDLLAGSGMDDVLSRWDVGHWDVTTPKVSPWDIGGLFSGTAADPFQTLSSSWATTSGVDSLLAAASATAFGVGSVVEDFARMTASTGTWADPMAPMAAFVDDFLRSMPTVDVDWDQTPAPTPPRRTAPARPDFDVEPDSAESTLLRRTEEILTDEALFEDFARAHDLIGVPDPVADWVRRRAALARGARRVCTSRPSRVAAVAALIWVHGNLPEAYDAVKDNVEYLLLLWLVAQGRRRNT